ncbi:DUF29 domain-containing protein [Cyanosarcina cf. burmensis CCALA 770]|nr:DUF29 domain-containing protein [Cyanosarcina cf. burmensis CCALA 770]
MKNLYEKDFYQWTQQTVQMIKDKQYNLVDWDNLIEEIETLGRSEKRAVKSHLVILLMHLLKWQYQPEHRSNSWKASIRNARTELSDLLQDNPSLAGDFLVEVLPLVYTRASEQAAEKTTIFLQHFPIECPYSLSQILDFEFLPS